MTVVRKFHPEVRLKQLLQEAGGVTAHTALERAEGNLDAIREQSLSAVDAKIEALSAMARTAQQPGPDIYKLANEIFAEAGAFGLVELSAAAHSLCSLMAAAESRSAPRAAVQVHVDAMRALRSPGVAGDKAARGAVLAGLRGLAARAAR